MECLDETTVARLLDRNLTADEKAAVVAHVDHCSACRQLVSALAQSQSVLGSHSAGVAGSFARGFEPTPTPHVLDIDPSDGGLVELGRYRLTKCVGRGAMGAVYEAHDPELGRAIAIKVLRLTDAGAREHLLREARALAAVSHPNVIAVYDVGTVGDQLFIALELVPTGTLREWLATPRSVRDIAQVMRDAARGLAAVHAANLVHRDVKPENILVDASRRVRIGDFGLVLPVGDAVASIDPAHALGSTTVTQTGLLVGTPAYMAPEQFGDDAVRTVDARTDQFSFCAMLHEAVHGVRPFAGDTVAELADAVKANRRTTPASDAPRWLRAIIDRGLAPDPRERFPAMDAIVDALDADARRRRLRTGIALGAGAAVGLAGVFVGVFVLHSGSQPADTCAGAGQEIAAVWNPTVRTAITDAFAASPKPYARDTATRAVARLDDYATAWTAKAREVCTTRTDSDLRNDCLAQRRDDLAALAKLLALPDDKLVAGAVDAAARLPALAQCDDLVALRQQRTGTGDTGPADKELRRRESDLGALLLAGKRNEARDEATKLAADAQAAGDLGVRIGALGRLAEIAAASGKIDEARALFEEAIATADRAGLDRLRAEIWANLISMLSSRRDDVALAQRLYPQAEAAIARLGTAIRPQLEVKWLEVSGMMKVADDPKGALELFRRGVARAAATLGKNSVPYVEAVERFTSSQQAFVTPAAHVDAMQKLVELETQLYGEHHPRTAEQRLYLGEAYLFVGKGDDAVRALRTSATDLEAAFGADDATVADAVTRLAGAYQLVGKLDEAIAANERAYAIRTKRFGATHVFTVENLVQRGRLQQAANKWKESVVTLEDARKISVDNKAPDLQIADLESDLAYSYGHVDRLADAEKVYRHSLAILEAKLGPTSPTLAPRLRSLGTVLVMAKKLDDARAPLERALAMLEKGTGDPLDLADVRLQLAYANEKRDKKRALDLAKAALAEYEKQKVDEAIAETKALIAKL